MWFENADSTKAKLDAVKASRIRGVYLWMYDGADDRTWDQLRHLLPTDTTPPDRHGHGTTPMLSRAPATGTAGGATARSRLGDKEPSDRIRTPG